MLKNLISRRNFLLYSSITATSFLAKVYAINQVKQNSILTVLGAVDAGNIGSSLIHEHILVDFIGADKVSPARYDRDKVFEKALPKLMELKNAGCSTLFECTPAYLGRDVKLLEQLSKASGLNIVSNTGFYGAAKEKYLPSFIDEATAETIAGLWINEFKNGIENTTIKPGFIKTGVDDFPLTERQIKILTAAARTHLETGLTIAVHTGNGKAAMKEMEIFQSLLVHPNAWIWVHAQNEKDHRFHINIARAGGWISYDSINQQSSVDAVNFLKHMKKENLLNKILISHDSGWYHAGEEEGGNFMGYTYIHKRFIPQLLQNGFTQKDITLLLETNPGKAFAVSIRKL